MWRTSDSLPVVLPHAPPSPITVPTTRYSRCLAPPILLSSVKICASLSKRTGKLSWHLYSTRHGWRSRLTSDRSIADRSRNHRRKIDVDGLVLHVLVNTIQNNPN